MFFGVRNRAGVEVIVLFIIICGPLLLICWYKNRPVPTEDPADIVKNLNCVKVSEFKLLRSMNYRHAPTPRNSVDGSSDTIAEGGDMNGTHLLTNPYEGENLGTALESCCICMEDFESGGPEATCVADMERAEGHGTDGLMVVLPCKSHFFHL